MYNIDLSLFVFSYLHIYFMKLIHGNDILIAFELNLVVSYYLTQFAIITTRLLTIILQNHFVQGSMSSTICYCRNTINVVRKTNFS